MNIKQQTIQVKDLFEQTENGMMLNGKIEMEQNYQREFLMSSTRQNKLIEDVLDGIPFGTLVMDESGDSWQVLDGRQRVSTLADFVTGNHAIRVNRKPLYFQNLTKEERESFLEVSVPVLSGEFSESERKHWFEHINRQGTNLSAQELRNNHYAGPFVEKMKETFVRDNHSDLDALIDDYTDSPRIRAKAMESVLSWAAAQKHQSIDQYMAENQNRDDIEYEINLFIDVCSWIKKVFPTWRQEMKKVDWGTLYRDYGNIEDYDPKEMDINISYLLSDPEITCRPGVYPFLFTGNLKYLSLRSFSKEAKQIAYERQKGRCAICGKKQDIRHFQNDHRVPWASGGLSTLSNLALLCSRCNMLKSDHPIDENGKSAKDLPSVMRVLKRKRHESEKLCRESAKIT